MREQLKSYHAVLAQFYLHPEGKFHYGDFTDRGFTRRRHVRAMVTEYIGKEANRWEEQFHLGLDLEAQTEYGLSPEGRGRLIESAKQISYRYGQRKLAAEAGMSLSELSAVLLGKRNPSAATLRRLAAALATLQRLDRDEADLTRRVLDEVRRRCQVTGLRRFARQAGVDPANLNRVLKGRSKLSQSMLAKLQALLAQSP
jgi:transcriptional regulator with XRE-family HTH domain